MKVRTFLLATVVALSWCANAQTPRKVTIEVSGNGVAVVGAKVMIAADEMDAIGQTDANGRVTVTTTSAKITVAVERNGLKASATSDKSTITVNLTGASQ